MTHRHTSSRHRLAILPAGYWRLPLVLAFVLASPAHSETGSMPRTDAEALRHEAVELISRLQRLEEKLLYPAHTRVSVFLSVPVNSKVQPHSVSIAIDDSTVTNHVYTQKEIGALHSGGIQRLYTGNTLMGMHKLRVSVRQTAKDGGVRTHALDYKFNKDENAENIEVVVNSDKPYILIQSRN